MPYRSAFFGRRSIRAFGPVGNFLIEYPQPDATHPTRPDVTDMIDASLRPRQDSVPDNIDRLAAALEAARAAYLRLNSVSRTTSSMSIWKHVHLRAGLHELVPVARLRISDGDLRHSENRPAALCRASRTLHAFQFRYRTPLLDDDFSYSYEATAEWAAHKTNNVDDFQ